MMRPLQFVGPPMDDGEEPFYMEDDPDYETELDDDDEASECYDHTNDMGEPPPLLVGVDSIESPGYGMSSSSVDDDSESDIISLDSNGDHHLANFLSDAAEDDDTFSELNTASHDDAQHELSTTELDDAMEQQSSADHVQEDESHLGVRCGTVLDDPGDRTRQESSQETEDDRAQQVVVARNNDDSTAKVPYRRTRSSSSTRIWQSDLLRYNNYLKKNHAEATMPERQRNAPEESTDSEPFQGEKTSKKFALVHQSNSNDDDLFLGGAVDKDVPIDGQGPFCLPAREVLPDPIATEQAYYISDDTMSAAPDDMECRDVAGPLDESYANEVCSTRVISCGDTIAPLEAAACGGVGNVVSSERLSDCDQNHVAQNMPYDIGLFSDKIGRDHDTDQQIASYDDCVVLEDFELSNGDPSGSFLERREASYGHEACLEGLTEVHDGIEQSVVSSVVSVRCSDTNVTGTFNCAAENEVEIPVDQLCFVEPRLETAEECVVFERVLGMGDDSALNPPDNEESTKVVVAMFEVGDVGTSEDALPIGDVVADIEEWPFDDPCSTGDPGKVCPVASKPVQYDVVERTEVVDDVSGYSSPDSEESLEVVEPMDDNGEVGTSEDDLCVEETTTATSEPTEFGGMWPHAPLAEQDDSGSETQPQQERASALEPPGEEIQGDIFDRVLVVADDLVRAPHNKESPDVMMAVDDLGADGTSAGDENVAATSEPTWFGGVWTLESLEPVASLISEARPRESCPEVEGCSEDATAQDSTMNPDDHQVNAENDQCREVEAAKSVVDVDGDCDVVPDYQGATLLKAHQEIQYGTVVQLLLPNDNSVDCDYVDSPEATNPLCYARVTNDSIAPQEEEHIEVHSAALKVTEPAASGVEAKKPLVDNTKSYSEPQETASEPQETASNDGCFAGISARDRESSESVIYLNNDKNEVAIDDGVDRPSETDVSSSTDRSDDAPVALVEVETSVDLHCGTEKQDRTRDVMGEVAAFADGFDNDSNSFDNASEEAAVLLDEGFAVNDVGKDCARELSTVEYSKNQALEISSKIEECRKSQASKETESKEQSNTCDESVGNSPVDGAGDESLCCLDDQAGADGEHVASSEHYGILPADDVELETPIEERSCTRDQADADGINDVEGVTPVDEHCCIGDLADIHLQASKVHNDCLVEHALAVKDDLVGDAGNMIPPDEVPQLNEPPESLSKVNESCAISCLVECAVDTIRAPESTENAICSQATEHLQHSERSISEVRETASDHGLVTLLQPPLPSTAPISEDCPKESAVSSCAEKSNDEPDFSAHHLTEAQDVAVVESHVDELRRTGDQAETPQEALEEIQGHVVDRALVTDDGSELYQVGKGLELFHVNDVEQAPIDEPLHSGREVENCQEVSCQYNVSEQALIMHDVMHDALLAPANIEIVIRVIGADYQYEQHAVTAVETVGTPDELHVALVVTLRRIPGCGVPGNPSHTGGAFGPKEEKDATAGSDRGIGCCATEISPMESTENPGADEVSFENDECQELQENGYVQDYSIEQPVVDLAHSPDYESTPLGEPIQSSDDGVEYIAASEHVKNPEARDGCLRAEEWREALPLKVSDCLQDSVGSSDAVSFAEQRESPAPLYEHCDIGSGDKSRQGTSDEAQYDIVEQAYVAMDDSIHSPDDKESHGMLAESLDEPKLIGLQEGCTDETSNVLETAQNAPDSFWSPSSAIEHNESRSEAPEVDVPAGRIAAIQEINALSTDPLHQVHPLGTIKTESSCTGEATDASEAQKLEFEYASENCQCDTDKRDNFVHPPDGRKSLDVVFDDPNESGEDSVLDCIRVEKSSVREIPSEEALEVQASLEIGSIENPSISDDDLLFVGDVEERVLLDGICFANDQDHDSSDLVDPSCAADIVKFPTISEVDHGETPNLTLDTGGDAPSSGNDYCYADHHDKSHQDALEAILDHVSGQPLAAIDGSSFPVNNVSKELTGPLYEFDDDVNAAREIFMETTHDVLGTVDMREPTCTTACDIAEGRYDPEVRTEAFCVSPVDETVESLLEAGTIRESAALVGQDLTLDEATSKAENPVYSFETKEELRLKDSEIEQCKDSFSPFEKVPGEVPCAADGNNETLEEGSTTTHDDVVEHNISPFGVMDAEVVKLAALLTKVVRVFSSEDQECQIGKTVKGVDSSEQSSTADNSVSFDGDIQEKGLVHEIYCTDDTNGRVAEALSMSANLINVESNEAAEIDVNIAPRSDDEPGTFLETSEKFVCSTDSPMPLFKHFESVSAKGIDAVGVLEPVVYSLAEEGRDVLVIDQCCVEQLKLDVSDFSAEHPNKVPVDVEEKALGDNAPSDCGDDFAVLHDDGFVLLRNDAATNKGEEDRPSTSRCFLQEDLAVFAWNLGLLQPLNEQDSKLPHPTANDFPVDVALSDEEHVARQPIAEAIKQTHGYSGFSKDPVVPTVHTHDEEWSKKELPEQDDSVQQPDHLKSPSIASTGSVGESLVDEEEGSSSAPSEDIEHAIADRLAIRDDSVRCIDNVGLPEMSEPLGKHDTAKDIASEDNSAKTMLETTDNPAPTSCEGEEWRDSHTTEEASCVDKSVVSGDSDHDMRPSIVNPVVVAEEGTVVLADWTCDNADEVALYTTLEESSGGNDDNASAKAVGESDGRILGATDQYLQQTFDTEKVDNNTEAQPELDSEKPALSTERAMNVSVGCDDTRQGTTNELQKDSVNAPPPRDLVENPVAVAVAPLDKVYNEAGLSSEHCDAEKITTALGTSFDNVGSAVPLYEQGESAASKESANTSSTTGGMVGHDDHDDLEARPEAPPVASERADDFVDRARRVPSKRTPRKFGLMRMFRKVLAGSDEDQVVLGKEQENVVLVNDGFGSGQQRCEAAIANETTCTGCILAMTTAGDVAPFVASPLEETDEEKSFTLSFSDYCIAPKPLQSSGFDSDELWI